MFALSAGAVLALLLFTSTAESTEPLRPPDCTDSARVDLGVDANGILPEVCVSPTLPTTLAFDSRVSVGSVEFQPEGRLADWAQGKENLSLMLRPKDNFLPGEGVKLTVHFADGEEPDRVEFWLVGHAAPRPRYVEVFRHPRPVGAARREAAEARAEALQCRQDKERLLAERVEPGGLMGTAWLERVDPMHSKDITQQLKRIPGNALPVGMIRSYRHAGSVAFKLHLVNPDSKPWTAAGAMLKDTKGEDLTLTPWQQAPISPGSEEGYVVLGAQRDPKQLACPCTLTLWEAQGSRTVTLGQVTFPSAE